MKWLWLALIASSAAHATPNSEARKRVFEAQLGCGNSVNFDEQNFYLGFGPYRRSLEEPRRAIPGELRVAPLTEGQAAYPLATLDGAIGAIRDGNTLYVLTYSGLEEWDLAARAHRATYDTFAHTGEYRYEENPTGFARHGDELVIAHGRLGVSFFNLTTKRLTNQFRLIPGQAPLESMATGVTVQGHFAYVVLDNYSLVKDHPPFRGFVVIDLTTHQVVAELGGMDPGADSVVSDGQRVIVGFSGLTVWKYDLGALGGRSLPEPSVRVWHYPLVGSPYGSPALDETYLYTCFNEKLAGGMRRRHPVAFDRAQLLLN